MRLWHQNMIQGLDRQRLLGQHRECCALRGKGWGKKHSVVNYVFDHSPARLVAYHYLIMAEMKRRGYHPDPVWENPNWRGNILGEEENWANEDTVSNLWFAARDDAVLLYPEHSETYLKECIDNLTEKGVTYPYKLV